ncbi:MAG: hypothetical protein KBD43_16935 [Saprospiraceae bacterium]|nr:hypothetical protein [Saprospiraceae bacterium]
MPTTSFLINKINISEIGYQCYCLNKDDSLLYILLPSGTLVVFDVATELLSLSILTSYTGVTSCFYDSTVSSIVYVREKSSLGVSDIIYYKLTVTVSSVGKVAASLQGLELKTFTIPALYFYINPTRQYVTMTSATEVFVYKIDNTCPDGFYLDSATLIC